MRGLLLRLNQSHAICYLLWSPHTKQTAGNCRSSLFFVRGKWFRKEVGILHFLLFWWFKCNLNKEGIERITGNQNHEKTFLSLSVPRILNAESLWGEVGVCCWDEKGQVSLAVSLPLVTWKPLTCDGHAHRDTLDTWPPLLSSNPFVRLPLFHDNDF